MSSEYTRMRTLLEHIGLRFEEHGITDAEIYAYAEGLSLLGSRLEEIGESIFPVSDFSRYIDLLQLNTALIPQENIPSAVTGRLSQGFAATTVSGQRSDYRLISRGNYAAQSNQMLYIVDPTYSFEEMKELGRFLLAYLPAGMTARCSDDGMPFEAWDALDKCFYELDSLQLPFSITDTLRRNNV